MTSMTALRHDEYEFDVFWSHSGVEKPFVVKLNKQLDDLRHGRASFNNFLDIQSNSLPAGQNIGANIVRAIGSCRIAVAFISKSFLECFWPMHELANLVDTCKPILPVFDGVEPGELVHNMDARVADWKKEFPFLTDETIKRWIHALRTIRQTKGYAIATDNVNVDANSPNVQRLLSDISLLLAALVLKEATGNDEKLELACGDINEELSHRDVNHMRESAAFLMRWDAIPNLVQLLKTLYETGERVTAEALWALDNILEKAQNGRAKAQAVNVGAVEILTDILMDKDGEVPAAYILRSILGSEVFEPACKKLKDKNKLRNGAIREKLMELTSGADYGCREACKAILRRSSF